MKLLADENIAQDTIADLRQNGFDVLDVKTTPLKGKSDQLIVEQAFRQKRLIISHDRQFIAPEKPPHLPVIVIIIRPGNQPPLLVADQVKTIIKSKIVPKLRGQAIKITVEGRLMRFQLLAVKKLSTPMLL